jgi:uncharacterized protein (UPF0248 family)
MAGRTLRDVLNRLRWDAGAGAGGVVVAVRLRVEGEERVEDVDFTAVAEILARGVTLADGTFLPYHRVVAVRRGGETLWRSGRV